jgi:hypothetical protein
VRAQALAEGFLPDPGDALEAGIALQLDRRIQAQQIFTGYHAVERRKFAALDFLLQRAARHAHQPRRPR